MYKLPDWVKRHQKEQEELQKAQLELDRQNMMQQMAHASDNLNLNNTLGMGNYNTIGTSNVTYTTSTYGTTTTYPNWGQFNIAPTAYVNPDVYASRNDAANRVMILRDTFTWSDLTPSIARKRFNHYGLEWRMI